MNFDKSLPGHGKADKDEMDMMQDIMGGDSSMNDLGEDLDLAKKPAAPKVVAKKQ
jgi:hypothetical protein